VVNIKVTEILDTSASHAFKILQDHRKYPKWWALPVTTKKTVLNYVEFKPLPILAIGIRVSSKDKDTTVHYEYLKGPFRGHGIWKFTSLEHGKTKISYEIFLKPTHWVYQLVSNTSLFARKHTADIKTIMRNIQNVS